MATAKVGTLPATGEQAITGVYSVSISQKWESRNGVGFTATLKRGTKAVASINQEGRGGMTFVDFTDPAEEKAFDDFVAQWTWTWGGAYNFPHDVESVVNILAFEAIEVKTLNSARNLRFLKTSDPERIYSLNVPVTKGMTTLPAGVEKFLAPGDRFWNKERWVVFK